ncbi:MAG: DUF4465 domain-containing protein [Muribaculaceae bacterium]|nr:DUF4465 domain-containing protein [Muribaculaceae bacterium]
MKKLYFFAGSLLAAAMALTSCSSDPEYDSTDTVEVSDESYSYDADGVWDDNLQSGFLNIDDYEFSHLVVKDDVYNTEYVYGFTPSKATDTSAHTPLYSFPYAAAAGGGVKGKGDPYLVAYWAPFLEEVGVGETCPFDKRTCRIYAEDGDQFEPQSAMVCVNTYLYYDVLNGSDFTQKFKEGDWVTLTAHGVHMDGTEAEATFYLVNVEGTDVESCIQKDWKQFDLTALGKCTGIYFTMDSSDKGQFGINTPTYFCLSNLVVKD